MRWLALLLLTGCVGGLDADLRLGRPDAGADGPAASVVLDASVGLDARTPDASDAADLRE